MSTETSKWILSAIASVLFLILTQPLVFAGSNQLNKISDKLATYNGSIKDCGPTQVGLVVHALLFFFIFRLILHFFKY